MATRSSGSGAQTQAVQEYTEVKLDLNRETKNTFRFDSPDEDCVIPSLYIRKSAFKGTTPGSIVVSVVGA